MSVREPIQNSSFTYTEGEKRKNLKKNFEKSFCGSSDKGFGGKRMVPHCNLRHSQAHSGNENLWPPEPIERSCGFEPIPGETVRMPS